MDIGIERADMRDEIFKFYDDDNSTLIRNYAPPGIGKTHLMIELIYAHIDEKFLIVIPNHEMAKGDGDLEDMLRKRHIDFIHVYGKTQPHNVYPKYCMRKDGEEHYPGCVCMLNKKNISDLFEKHTDTYDFDLPNKKARCIHRHECPYKAQMRNVDDYQVIICVLEHASMFNDRVLIFDESFEQKLLSINVINMDQIDRYSISLKNDSNPKLGGSIYKFWSNVKLLKNIEIIDAHSYFMDKFFENTTKISAYLTREGNVCLFGRTKNYMPERYTRIIFNCATTPIGLMQNITNTEFSDMMDNDLCGWSIYKSKRFDNMKLLNPIIKFKHNWTKKLSEKWISLVIKYFTMFGKNLLIVTKKDIKEVMSKEFPNATFVHFNAGRGFNSADNGGNYDLLIQFGRFGFTPVNREMFRLIGFSEKLVHDMEISEMLQCLHRGRPLLHPNVPIIMMSDRDIFPDIEPLSVNLLQLFYDHYDAVLTDDSYDELMIKLNVKSRNKVNQFKYFAEFVRNHVYKMNEPHIEQDSEFISPPHDEIVEYDIDEFSYLDKI